MYLFEAGRDAGIASKNSIFFSPAKIQAGFGLCQVSEISQE